MPDKQEVQTPITDRNDLLEQLLVAAAEKAATREAEDALKKGFVTREQINQAFAAFGESIEARLGDRMAELLTTSVPTVVQKALEGSELVKGGRRSTVIPPEEELENDPVAFLLKKGKTEGAESYSDVEKRVIWAMTERALSDGMLIDQQEED